MKTVLILSSFALVACLACQSAPKGGGPTEPAAPISADGLTVDQVLDDWHLAASEVDADRYLGFLAEDSIFLGTDPGERWDKAQFTGYVDHYFKNENRGWTYRPSERNVSFAPNGRLAWFDERLDNDRVGALRGTGVLELQNSGWRILHYSMTFAIPNGKVDAMVIELGLAPADPAAPEPGQ